MQIVIIAKTMKVQQEGNVLMFRCPGFESRVEHLYIETWGRSRPEADRDRWAMPCRCGAAHLVLVYTCVGLYTLYLSVLDRQ